MPSLGAFKFEVHGRVQVQHVLSVHASQADARRSAAVRSRTVPPLALRVRVRAAEALVYWPLSARLTPSHHTHAACQGVFFRAATVAQAQQLQLVGWCANTARRTVVGEVQGPLDRLAEMKVRKRAATRFLSVA